jgi:hypothetical protein
MKASVVKLASVISKRMINVNIWSLELEQMEKEEMEKYRKKLAEPKYKQQPVPKNFFQGIIEEMCKMEMEVEKLFESAGIIGIDELNSLNLQLK